MGCANPFPVKIWGQVTRKRIETGLFLYSHGSHSWRASLCSLNLQVPYKLLQSGLAVDDQGRVRRRGLGGAVLFERVKLHDATKQTNDSGPHSPFTSGAATAPCQRHRCSVDKLADITTSLLDSRLFHCEQVVKLMLTRQKNSWVSSGSGSLPSE
jgi:hypothetical protein